jgi:hypothetical protein
MKKVFFVAMKQQGKVSYGSYHMVLSIIGIRGISTSSFSSVDILQRQKFMDFTSNPKILVLRPTREGF